MDLAKEYTNWLYENMTEEELSPGMFELTTPFLDRNNDYTQIYIQYNDDGTISISDNGYIIDDLSMSGFEFSTSKRKELLNKLISSFGLSLKNEVIYTNIDDPKDLAETKHRLLQAMLYINDMFVLNRPNVKSLFFEDVSTFFDTNDIRYSANIDFIGKSTLVNKFDYVIPKSKVNPERIIKLMNNPTSTSRSGNIVFSWMDTLPNRPKSTQLFVILNDENGTSSKVIDVFKNYSDFNIEPILWSSRNDYIDKLA